MSWTLATLRLSLASLVIALPMREDAVSDGGDADTILANAPEKAADFFVVPKVIE